MTRDFMSKDDTLRVLRVGIPELRDLTVSGRLRPVRGRAGMTYRRPEVIALAEVLEQERAAQAGKGGEG